MKAAFRPPRTFKKTRKVLERAIPIESLPALVPKQLACDFSLLTARTLDRAVEKGLLTPVKRNARSVSYRKEDLLAYLGLTASSKKSKK